MTLGRWHPDDRFDKAATSSQPKVVWLPGRAVRVPGNQPLFGFCLCAICAICAIWVLAGCQTARTARTAHWRYREPPFDGTYLVLSLATKCYIGKPVLLKYPQCAANL